MKILQTPVGVMEVFCYLVSDENSGDCILIDPAGDEDRLMRLLQQDGLTLRYIVNTHGHADHTCGNARLQATTSAAIVMHELDDDFFSRRENQEFARIMGFSLSPRANVRIRDGDELTFGSITMRFLHTPGHTPGACCILIGDNLFTGDTLFVGAVGRTDLPGASFEQLLESLKNKIMTLPPATLVWPGHDYGDRPQSTIAHEVEFNPYLTDFF
ncbi:MAG TPA: MBL fold metallo-hydrolase [Syntrophobacteraceae bacterium]|nr:MBL fold metallo-hydrolase [Syntrophobacteraceae bacterium]